MLVSQLTRTHADGKPVAGQQFDYAFDTIGNRTRTLSGGDTNGVNLRLANYYANSLNQITQRDVPGTNDVVGVSWVTNSVNVNGTPANRKGEYFRGTVGANNTNSALWLTTIVTNLATGINVTGNVYVAQQPEVFQYDADGNLTSDGRWNYTWDAENRLVMMTVSNNTVGPQYQLTFAYDYQGRRIQKIVATNSGTAYVTQATHTFLYDGWNLVAELNPDNSRIRTYMWGSDLSGTMQGAGGVGGLLEVSYYGAGATNYCFPAFDGNGNVSALINAADGTVVANYDYAAFGEPIRITGSMAKNNPFRFSTKYADDESDMLYYGYRYYKPSTGTWPNRDPDEESAGMSLYCFVQNEPVSSIDELGMIQFAGPYIHTDGIPPDLGAEPAASGVTVQTPLSFNITPIGCGFLWLGEKIQPLNFTVQFDIYFINAAAENQKTMTKETSLDHEKKHVQYLKEALSKVDKLVSGVGRICYYCEPCKTLRRDVVYKGVDDANAWRDYENDLLDYQDYFPGPYKDAKKAALVNDAAAFNAAKAAYNKAVNEYNAHCK